MDKGGIFLLLLLLKFVLYFIIRYQVSTKLESFGGYMNWSLVRFEYEKSPLHTIVYDGSGTGKTYFIRQYLK